MTETEKAAVSTLETHQLVIQESGLNDVPVAMTSDAEAVPKPSQTGPSVETPGAAVASSLQNLGDESFRGLEGEEEVWTARYSMLNFIGRLTLRTILTVAWAGLAVYTWGMAHTNLGTATIVLGVVLALFWLTLIYRIIKARFGHFYRLTNRRLFVSTGLMRRRRDQVELLRVKDVYTRQTLVERWLEIGTVVVVSSESALPTFYLAGVDHPKQVMDLVWHHSRTEREGKTVQVENMS